MIYGYDPSPPRPKSKQGGGKRNGKVVANSRRQEGEVNGGPTLVVAHQALIEPTHTEVGSEMIELPLVTLGIGEECADAAGEWFIRATQGHSLKLDSIAHLTPILDDEESRARAGLLVHGTKWELWDTLSKPGGCLPLQRLGHFIETEGLSRMSRQHIHLAPALSDHRITPRPTSTLYIYLDLDKLLAAKIPVYSSSNGVILTPGNQDGVIPEVFWSKAERKVNGKHILILEDGKEVVATAAAST